MFSVGLKNIAAADGDQVEQLVLDALATLAAEGIERDMIAASLNTVEFQLREANTGSFPRGLMVMLRGAGRLAARGRSAGRAGLRGAAGAAQAGRG